MSSEVVTQLEQDATKRMYERLISSHDKVKTYDEGIARDLEGSRMFQDVFCCADPIYMEQLDIIKASMPDVVKDDTVGEHLYGCFQPELAIEIACTPACADGGLENPNLSPCELPSYEKKGTLKKLNDISGEEANVFIAANNTLNRGDIDILRQQGILVITTYEQDEDTINYILGETINLYREDPHREVTNTTDPVTSDSSNNNNDTSWAWMWILVILAIIILIILFFLGSRS